MKLVLDTKGLKSKIGKAILAKYEKSLREQFEFSAIEIKDILIRNFLLSPTYNSLTSHGGTLRSEFGLTSSDAAEVEDIVSNFDLVHSEQPKFRTNNNIGFSLKMNYGISYKDLRDVDTDSGSFVTEKGDIIPWLYWLLFAGTETVITEYSVKFKAGIGRSGGAVMIRRKNGREYSVDPQYAGTVGDNWITETVSKSRNEIETVLKKIFSVLKD